MSRFDEVAKHWDSKSKRVAIGKKAVQMIRSAVEVKDKRVLDYGCGTGLLSYGLAQDAKWVEGMDSSKGMLEVFEQKNEHFGFDNVQATFHDANHDRLAPDSYDLIVSSMTFHHIKDVTGFIKQCYEALSSGGTLCIVDLDKEDGSFHSDNCGVQHFGFCHETVHSYLSSSGFTPQSIENICTINKDAKEYPVFLAVGAKQ